jgi:hypothetical protein
MGVSSGGCESLGERRRIAPACRRAGQLLVAESVENDFSLRSALRWGRRCAAIGELCEGGMQDP